MTFKGPPNQEIFLILWISNFYLIFQRSLKLLSSFTAVIDNKGFGTWVILSLVVSCPQNCCILKIQLQSQLVLQWYPWGEKTKLKGLEYKWWFDFLIIISYLLVISLLSRWWVSWNKGRMKRNFKFSILFTFLFSILSAMFSTVWEQGKPLLIGIWVLTSGIRSLISQLGNTTSC